MNVRSGDVAFSVVQAEVVGSKLQKRGSGGRERDEGEDSGNTQVAKSGEFGV